MKIKKFLILFFSCFSVLSISIIFLIGIFAVKPKQEDQQSAIDYDMAITESVVPDDASIEDKGGFIFIV